MIQAYDLFKEDERGTRIFVETVIGMHQAKKRLMKLTSLKPGKYRIYDPTEARFVEPFIVPARLNSTAKQTSSQH
jgi:hypothetical protein